MKNKNGITSKKITYTFISIFLLIICTCVTTFALVHEKIVIEDNYFVTGDIKLNLNDGKPVINEDTLFIEPGMTIKRDFFLENISDNDAYFRIYFDNVSGELSEVLNVEIKEDNKVLFTGKVVDLSRDNLEASDEILKANERKDLQLTIYFPKESGNKYQDNKLQFNLVAEGVQVKNNDNKEFN